MTGPLFHFSEDWQRVEFQEEFRQLRERGHTGEDAAIEAHRRMHSAERKKKHHPV